MSDPANSSPESPAARQPIRWSVLWLIVGTTILVGGLVAWRLGAGTGGSGTGKETSRTIVFIVHGTNGNGAAWFREKPGMSTFSSELRRALPAGSEVRAFAWNGENDHAGRERAATKLAQEIDRHPAATQQIVIVGHSHGGNVAMSAAALVHRRISLVVCLGTPHLYLVTPDPKDPIHPVMLPVHCRPATLSNSDRILSIGLDSDAVAPLLRVGERVPGLGGTAVGLTVEEAICATECWRSHGRDISPVDSGLLLERPLRPDLRVSARLYTATSTTCNIVLQPHPARSLGERDHHVLHSRRMGAILGKIVATAASPEEIAYLERLVIPSNADDGEPIAEREQREWCRQQQPLFDRVAWRTTSAEITLCAEVRSAVRDIDGSPPDPRLELSIPGTGERYRSPTCRNSMQGTWSALRWICSRPELVLTVVDADLGRSQPLGTHRVELTADKSDATFTSAPSRGQYWSGRVTWESVHY